MHCKHDQFNTGARASWDAHRARLFHPQGHLTSGVFKINILRHQKTMSFRLVWPPDAIQCQSFAKQEPLQETSAKTKKRFSVNVCETQRLLHLRQEPTMAPLSTNGNHTTIPAKTTRCQHNFYVVFPTLPTKLSHRCVGNGEFWLSGPRGATDVRSL